MGWRNAKIILFFQTGESTVTEISTRNEPTKRFMTPNVE